MKAAKLSLVETPQDTARHVGEAILYLICEADRAGLDEVAEALRQAHRLAEDAASDY